MADENGQDDDSAMSMQDNLGSFAEEAAFLKKYFALRKKCEQVQQANEKLVNRIQHAKKMIKRYKRENRHLAHRLDSHGDTYRDTQVPVLWEEDQLYNFVRPPPPYIEPSPGDDANESNANNSIMNTPSPSVKSIEKLASIHPILTKLGSADGSASSSAPAAVPRQRRVKSEREHDPNMPKKPMNAFLMFCQEKRTQVLEQHNQLNKEDISHQELTKLLALSWNQLNMDEKKDYYEMYKHDKERYETEMEAYKERESLAADVKPDIKSISATTASHSEKIEQILLKSIKQEVDSS